MEGKEVPAEIISPKRKVPSPVERVSVPEGVLPPINPSIEQQSGEISPPMGGRLGKTTSRNRSLEIGREIIADSKAGELWEGQVDDLEKKVIEGRFIHDLSAAAIAEQLGISQNQVENMQRGAMLRLRRAVNIQKNKNRL